MSGEVKIRTVIGQDAAELVRIYAPYVLNTAVTFEYDVPTVEEFAERIRRIKLKYPYLAAESDGEILGYAYAGPFKERAAYDRSVETSIYVKDGHKGCGIGRKLYDALEGALKEQGILNLYACIAYPEREDSFLTKDSVAFHEKMGYQTVGRFHRCGYKFGRWYDMVWMEKFIGTHSENPQELKAFDCISAAAAEKHGDI